MPVQELCDLGDVTMGYRIAIFEKLSVRNLNKIKATTMPVNPYDDPMVSLRRPHGKCDLDIVQAS